MNRRHLIYGGLIALLAVVNVGRWWLGAAREDGASMARGKAFFPDDFRLRVATGSGQDGPHRDLFQQATSVAVRKPSPVAMVQPHVIRATATSVAQVPPDPPEAQAPGSARLKLLGVVFRDGKGQAYLAADKENVIAMSGDVVLGRYVVDRIAVDAVDLRDSKTNITTRVPVSGR